MSDEPTHHSSSDPSGRRGLKHDSDDPPLKHAERTPGQRGGWRNRARSRIDRILPPVQSSSERRLTNPLPGIVLFLFLLGIAFLSIVLIRPPAALPATAPADQFSAERAMPHIEALATQPHPVGSSAHAQARDYVIAQLEHLGLEPQVQKAVATSDFRVANVENVLARLPGSNGGGKAVLLTAHYDSVESAPGASDDASGVATLLETARALKAGSQPLANDVIFFFEDGEEEMLKGQTAFVEQHPWAEEVGLVLLFDADILAGPCYAVAPPDNNWPMAQCVQAAPYPLVNSLSPEIDQLLGNDFYDVFVTAGYPELGFSTNSGSAYYHTVLDNVSHVELESLQHQGSYALSLVRRFGEMDLTASYQSDPVYFNFLGSHLLVHYSQGWIFSLLALAVLVWVGALVFGLRWRLASLRGVLLGALASAVIIVVLAVVGYLLKRLVLIAYPQYDASHFEVGANTYNGVYYWSAFMALGVGLAALFHNGLRTRLRATELALGGLLLVLGLAVFASIALPGASYAFTWALLFGSLGLWGWFVLRRHGFKTPWRVAWLALFAVPAALLIPPLLYSGAPSTGIEDIYIPMGVLGLLTGTLAIHLEIMARPRKSWLPALMGLAVVGFLVAGHLTSDYTPTRPLRDGIYYALSADEGKAYWNGGSGTDIDPYTEQFLAKDGREGDYRNIFPWEHETTSYQASAPLADLPEPKVEELPATSAGTFRLHVVPTPGANAIELFTMPGPVPGMTFYLDNGPVESDGLLLYFAPPSEGFEVNVEAPDLDSLTLRVVNFTPGLPALPGIDYEPRPDWIIPNARFEDFTAVAKTFTFEKE